MADNLFGDNTLPEPHKIVHSRDPFTSSMAALKALKNAKGLNRLILDELTKVFPLGLSHEALAERLGIESSVSGNDVAKRCSTLKSKGLIEQARETSLNSKGNPVATWKLYYPPNDKQSRWEP